MIGFRKNFNRAVSLGLALCLLASLALKNFHHIDHGGRTRCCAESKANHFHSELESEHCAVCEFFFSPFREEVIRFSSVAGLPLCEDSHSVCNERLLQIYPFNYSLRAPPPIA